MNVQQEQLLYKSHLSVNSKYRLNKVVLEIDV